MHLVRLVPSVVALVCLLLARTPAQDVPAPPARETLVALLLYDGVELLDFAGPGEVFSSLPRTRVVTVAARPGALGSMGVLEVVPAFTPQDCPEPDVIVVPGGAVPTPDAALVDWLAACVARGGVVMSVCNGALLLARAGLLAGREATTHHSAFEALAVADPTITVLRNRRFVDHGSVMTTAGISAGIDGALHLAQRLFGERAARDAARYMEYDWRPEEIAGDHARPGDAFDLGLAGRLLRALREPGVGVEVVADRHAADVAALDDAARVECERLLNRGGYAFSVDDLLDDAARVFELQVRLFPASANPCDSLAECCERRGERGRALELSRRALTLLPDDRALAPGRAARIRAAAEARVARLSAGDA